MAACGNSCCFVAKRRRDRTLRRDFQRARLVPLALGTDQDIGVGFERQGIRMALGAQRGGVVRMVLRDVLGLVAAGLLVGIAAALATSKFVASFLYGMTPNDPLALTLGVITLLAAALLAAYVPARQASCIDPLVALRHD